MSTIRILVDMSATLILHGHVRLLKKAKEIGTVVEALTTDEKVKIKKGYKPELSFEERKEILKSILYVDKVIPLSEAYPLAKHKYARHCLVRHRAHESGKEGLRGSRNMRRSFLNFSKNYPSVGA